MMLLFLFINAALVLIYLKPALPVCIDKLLDHYRQDNLYLVLDLFGSRENRFGTA